MKIKKAAIILAILFGGLGVHKFYLGRYASGILYLVFCWTLIPMFLGFVDAVVYLSMSRETWDDRYNWLRLNMKPAHSPARP